MHCWLPTRLCGWLCGRLGRRLIGWLDNTRVVQRVDRRVGQKDICLVALLAARWAEKKEGEWAGYLASMWATRWAVWLVVTKADLTVGWKVNNLVAYA